MFPIAASLFLRVDVSAGRSYQHRSGHFRSTDFRTSLYDHRVLYPRSLRNPRAPAGMLSPGNSTLGRTQVACGLSVPLDGYGGGGVEVEFRGGATNRGPIANPVMLPPF
jgi:hypothetical protein